VTPRRTRKRLEIRRETFRRLADGELSRVAGGAAARCTYDKSGCFPQPLTNPNASGGGMPT